MSLSSPRPLPTDLVLRDAVEHLQEGSPVLLPVRGRSMEPTLRDQHDSVRLTPCTTLPHRGDIVLFLHGKTLLLHRVVRTHGDTIVLRGDASTKTERTTADKVYGTVTEVLRDDGSRLLCSDPWWRKNDKVALRRSAWRTCKHQCTNPTLHRQVAPWYIATVLLLMWLPLNGLGLPLNNFVLGIRADHLLHASVYLPCVLAIAALTHRRGWLPWAMALLMACATECVQYLLPYRGFDINDLVSNLLGVVVGGLLLRKLVRRQQ